MGTELAKLLVSTSRPDGRLKLIKPCRVRLHYLLINLFMDTSNLLLLLITGLSHHLPGLGVLALPQTTVRLPFPRHTALVVKLGFPAGDSLNAVATVEEIDRNGVTFSGLLLQLESLADLPPGTRIWLASGAA